MKRSEINERHDSSSGAKEGRGWVGARDELTRLDPSLPRFYAQPLLSHRYCNTIYHELTVRLERASGILIV